jgi:hypothetical protein
VSVHRVPHVISVVLLVLSGASVVSAAASDPVETARAILARERYQTELPVAPEPERVSPARPPAPWPEAERGPDPGGQVVIPLPGSTLGFLFLIAIVVVGLVLILRSLPVSSAAEVDGVAPASPEKGTPLRPQRLGDADALARGGRFAEAIHALLLHALVEMSRRVHAAASPAATSREIVGSAAVPAAVRGALGPLVSAVEWVHFGPGTAGPEDYATCLAHYQRFQEACRRTA